MTPSCSAQAVKESKRTTVTRDIIFCIIFNFPSFPRHLLPKWEEREGKGGSSYLVLLTTFVINWRHRGWLWGVAGATN